MIAQEKRPSEKEYEAKLLEQKADHSLKTKKALEGYENGYCNAIIHSSLFIYNDYKKGYML